ncbi:MAG: GNAT family N-acetyltransferase [Sphingomonadaceae bacterium]|nr:GNAT family N-acetyltransferase [Sphingomonadaceae bacterium]
MADSNAAHAARGGTAALPVPENDVAMSRFTLRFSVGERTVLKATRSVGAQEASLLELLEQRPPPVHDLPDGVIYRSMPVGMLAGLNLGPSRIVYRREAYPRYFTDLGGTFDAYLAAMSGNARSTLRRKVKAYAKSCGEPDFREYRTPPQLAEFFELASLLSKRTYQHRRLNAGLPDSAAFRSEALAKAARDEIRAYLLFHNGRPVSYLYAPSDEGVVVYDRLGYDPDYAQHSVGAVLQFEVMNRLFGEGRWRYFDFTPGDGQHKRQFATGSVECADVLILPNSAANRALVGAHRSFCAAVERAGAWAERHGARTRLRRLLRGV